MTSEPTLTTSKKIMKENIWLHQPEATSVYNSAEKTVMTEIFSNGYKP